MILASSERLLIAPEAFVRRSRTPEISRSVRYVPSLNTITELERVESRCQEKRVDSENGCSRVRTRPPRFSKACRTPRLKASSGSPRNKYIQKGNRPGFRDDN